MAWQAKVTSPIAASTDNRLTVAIDFYDDVDPTTILHSRTWTLPVGTTTAQLQAEVVREGQAARSAYLGSLTAQSAVPVGTTVAIP